GGVDAAGVPRPKAKENSSGAPGISELFAGSVRALEKLIGICRQPFAEPREGCREQALDFGAIKGSVRGARRPRVIGGRAGNELGIKLPPAGGQELADLPPRKALTT